MPWAGDRLTIVADSGPIFAGYDRSDPDHDRVRAILLTLREPVIAPLPVVIEVALLLQRRLGPAHEARFLRACGSREIEIEMLTDSDFSRAAEIVEQYADARVAFIDASVVAIAERLNIARVLTLDRRDFSIIRPRHCPAFELLP